MSKTPIEIKVDLDKKCKGCGKGGATQSGYCMACVAKGIKDGKFDHIIKPIKEAVKSVRRPEMSKEDKITVETKIKSCNIKSNGESLTFDCITLTDSQREKVIDWVKNKENGRLSFEPVQGKLTGM